MIKIALLLLTFGLCATSNAHVVSKSCQSHLGRIADGATAYGWASSIGTNDEPCFQMAIACHHGTLSGPDLYRSCRTLDTSGASCGNWPAGSTQSGWASPLPPCYFTTAVCINGKWDRPIFGSCQN